uniref:Mitochondrial fission factor n=1 Tax=Caenorhabditis tropicalis TaxID=1561998 RepID=A0A1I7USB2_9PELO
MYMPEHISGTGDPMSMAGMESFPNANSDEFRGVVEAGHDQFSIPEEAINPLYTSPDYMRMIDQLADHYHEDLDAHCEADPIRQIKTIRTQLRDISHTLDQLLENNNNRDRREQYIWAGLAGLAVVTLISLFRK